MLIVWIQPIIFLAVSCEEFCRFLPMTRDQTYESFLEDMQHFDYCVLHETSTYKFTISLVIDIVDVLAEMYKKLIEMTNN